MNQESPDTITNDQEVDPILLRRKISLRQQQLKMMKEFGLLFYKPHKKQERFHQAAEFRFRLLRAGNRFGKSDCGVGEDLAFALGERPWLREDDPNRYIGIPKYPTKGLIVCADLGKVDEIFTGEGKNGHVGKIWKKIPKSLVIGKKKDSTGTIVNLVIKGKYGPSVIDFVTRSSYKTNPMGSESSDYDWCHIDEPIEQGQWKAILRGLTDRDGKAWFTCTLLEQPWINDFFFPDPKSMKEESHEIINAKGRKQKWCITGQIHDNPYLTPDAIEEFLSELTEDERACRESGIPMHLSGLVYKEFDFDRHVLQEVPKGWTTYNTPPLDHTIRFAIDNHPRTPHAILFAATAPSGRVYFYQEFFQTGTPKEMATWIKPFCLDREVVNKWIDPSAYIIDQRDNSSFAADLQVEGVHGLEKASKDLSRGIQLVRQELKEKDNFYFSPDLKTFLWEINRWAWADKNGVPSNKPVDKDDHLMECFYRLVIGGLEYVDPTDYGMQVDDEEIVDSETSSLYNMQDDLTEI